MNIAITGATGFIGQHLVDFLLDQHSLTVVGRDRETLERLYDQRQGVRISGGGYAEQNLKPVCEQVESVIHLAARRPESEDQILASEPMQQNIDVTNNVLKAAGEAGVRSVALASTILVYPEQDGPFREEEAKPFDTYGAGRWTCEHLGRIAHQTYDMGVTALRLSSIYGTGGRGLVQTFLNQAQDAGTLTLYNNGQAERDILHVSDAVRAFERVLNRSGFDIYNIGGGGHSIRTVAETIASVLDRQVHIQHEDREDEPVFRHVMDCTKAKEHLDWAPKKSLKQGLRTMLKNDRSEHP